MSGLDLVLGALLVHRLSRLVADDAIAEGLRGRIEAWAEESDLGDWVYEMATCRWCVSIWIAAAAAVTYAVAPTEGWRLAAAAGAWSSVAGLLAGAER